MSDIVEIKKDKALSYSSAVDLKNCGWYYKLQYVDGISAFRDSIDTYFGKVVHKYVQEMLEKKDSINIEKHKIAFEAEWKKVCEEQKSLVTEKDNLESLTKAGINIISVCLSVFEKELPFKEVVAIEHGFEEPISQKRNFKGFIDIIFKMQDGSYIIGDIKTCGSAYMFKKFQDATKEYQLVAYKWFYSKSQNIDLKNIRTIFILVEKDFKSKNPIQFSEIISDDKKIQNCLTWINKTISIIDRGLFLKNRLNCRNYGRTCVFYDTEHCKNKDI